MVWCGACYQREESDRFQINELLDEFGAPMYDCESDKIRFKQGIDGAHLMVPFHCDLCIFRTLWGRNPRNVISDKENLQVLRRMNLDLIWSREPSTFLKNAGSLSMLISTCESSGFDPELPHLGPSPLSDKSGLAVAFSMLRHSLKPGRHSKLYTQFATIRKQRSAFSNLYLASIEGAKSNSVMGAGPQGSGFISACPTNSPWFVKWSTGCEVRMGFILKQNKAISYTVFRALIKEFSQDILKEEGPSEQRQRLCMGLVYSVISFCASLRGNETMKLDFETLTKYFDRGLNKIGLIPGHVIVPLKGRFKGESGERCHLLPLANVSANGINIRGTLKLLIKIRREMNTQSPWAFVSKDGNRLSFASMNEIIMDKLEIIQIKDEGRNELGLKELNIREDFSINRSFRRGSSTHAQNMKVPANVIEAQNRWRKVERAKGNRPKFTMIETYADIEQLIPTLVQYSAML
jgi:hypothetical protein